MRRQSAISAILLLATTLVIVVRADETDIRKELEHIGNIQLQAFNRKDVKAYLKYIAPNYSTTTLEGYTSRQPRPQLERETLSDMENTISIDFVIRDIKEVKVKGGEIVVVVSQKSSRVLKDEGSRHKWETSVVQREKWIKTDEGLKLYSIEMLEVVYLIKDGKLITGSKEKDD